MRDVEGSPPVVLQTERLIVRPFTLGDAGFILRLLNEPSFIENIADKGVRSLEDARRYLRDGPLASYALHGFGLWRVGLKEGDDSIGMAGILKRDVLDDIDLGYALLPEYCGQGYGHEAVVAIVDYARERLGHHRLVAVVNEDNKRSVHLLNKLGFVHERMVRLDSDQDEIRLYALDL